MTEEERDYVLWAKSIGCVCCYQLWPPSPTFQTVEFNHHLHAGKRIGNNVGTPECVWHHRGDPKPGYTKSMMLEKYGPARNYQGEKGGFEKRFGSDQRLLEVFAEMVRS